MRCGEGLSIRVSNIIRRYIDHMKFADYMAFFVYQFISSSFGSLLLLLYIIYVCIFCMLLFNSVNYVFYCYVYVFLLLCIFLKKFIAQKNL